MIIDGAKIAAKIQQELFDSIKHLHGRPPSLHVVIVGHHPPSEIYVKRKTEACSRIGILSHTHRFSAEITENELLAHLQKLNAEAAVDGILVQLPLPAHIHSGRITQAVAPDKDVDGFHMINLGKLLIGDPSGFIPCTPLGIQTLLTRSSIEISGKHVVIIGRSQIVGKPMATLLMQNTPQANATVTVAHSQTKNLKSICQTADILIAAIGQPRFVTEDMVKEGCVVIDVGINRVAAPHLPKGYEIVGDVDFQNVQQKCAFITPVPGGVGPMTIAMLLSNTYKSYCLREGLQST
ncbi:bifunctional methylenetetrahydrofolate dehydrogenase/methenyltetrahydrofolate cyclohydrolase FolD [Parachlamydia sp. AcF125]|uniref:bifunctional methylenetetrahydrofolate dehydrogenase/methenyltetrahydrofolate cyclohydrolase FolD n=1 Tax=Parachlamydia sp. AcF125 TaxID=2795736 RepID=UPI001BC9B0F9|nr:bifunctional methylenetetrahydrofolate dehydrogenase/methenyltetrahydrofolate cyclohydrolase FolD [Parachlamydia sp. AcF125]MBS4169149.1 Bifunctional protein FolD protein [Parachlamydia sp. AcF125]